MRASGLRFSSPSSLLEAVTRLFDRPSYAGLLDWAERERIISKEASDQPGPYRVDKTPWMAEPLRCIFDPAVEMVVMQKSAQVGWTDGMVNNFWGYVICVEPGPGMMMFPTEDSARRWNSRKFEPMLRDTPAMVGRIQRKTSNARDAALGSTVTSKTFTRGFLELVGSNSSTPLSDLPVRYLVIEEPDRCAMNPGGEGPSIDLAIERTKTFTRRKLIIGGSPTFLAESQVCFFMEQTDRRQFLIPCKHCKHEQPLAWDRVVWDIRKGRGHPVYGDVLPETAKIKCVECGRLMTNAEKNRQVKKGRWEATGEFAGAAGFQINELYSLAYNSRLPVLVRRYLAARREQEAGDPKKMQAFMNTALGLPWKQTLGKEIDRSLLESKREDLRGTFPAKVIYLTAGVDVQKDRLEMEVIGWSEQNESWGLAYVVIAHPPEGTEAWDELAKWLDVDFTREDGAVLRVGVMAVDSGNWTSHVYAFCRKYRPQNVFAVKGKGGPGHAYATKAKRTATRRVDLMMLGVDSLKDLNANRLQVPDPGPGYCHISADYPSDWEEQMRAETRVKRKSRGQIYHIWEQTGGKANEALDCRVYALAAKIFGKRILEELARAPTTKTTPQPRPDPEDRPASPKSPGFADRARRGSWFGR